MCAWINVWISNREAGVLRPHCAHYDVIVMKPNKVGTLCIRLVMFCKTKCMHLYIWKDNCANSQLIYKHFIYDYILRKSKDYVYGIWVYKALDIWKGYYRVKKSLVSYMKPWTEARNNKYMKYHSKLTYQLSFWNVSRKVDYHAGGKWFIHGPKRRKENQLLSLKHPCWLSLV